jgi:hypothetical protein
MTDVSDPDSPASNPDAPPGPIADYARTCVQQVAAAVGVLLDYQPETLPLLDHYLRQARPSVQSRPQTLPLLIATAGAYLGELLRQRYPCRWRLDSDDPLEWRIEFTEIDITVYPVAIAREALTDDSGLQQPVIELNEQDRDLLAQRLDALPPVVQEQYVAPSTRIEVIDIAVDALRATQAHAAARPDGSPPQEPN